VLLLSKFPVLRPGETFLSMKCFIFIYMQFHGYLSGARYKLFAYGPADATATPSSLAPVKSRMVYLSGAGLPRLSWKKAVKRMQCR